MPERDLNQMLARLRLLEHEYPKLQAERDELDKTAKWFEEMNAEHVAKLTETRKQLKNMRGQRDTARRERDAALAALAKILKEAESENSAIDSLVAIVGIINEMEVLNND